MQERLNSLLRECIDAEYYSRLLIDDYRERRERIFAGHYPGYDTTEGNLNIETISVENAIIYLLDAEKEIKQHLKEHSKSRKLYKEAYSLLNAEEKELFNHIVWGEPLRVAIEQNELFKAGDEVKQKFMKYIERIAL